MAREFAWTMALVAVIGLCACAGIDEPEAGDASADAMVAKSDAANLLPKGACEAHTRIDFDPRPTDMLLVLDRSTSMDTAFGAGSRYQGVADMLSSMVQLYATHVRFGFQEMPGRQSCATQGLVGCCASPPLVAVGGNNTDALLSAISGAAPMDGNTPTAGALRAAGDYFATLADGVSNRFVLLATDGAPNCSADGTLVSSGNGNIGDRGCADATAQVGALAAQGVRTIVLGVGSDLVDDVSGASACLDAMAHAGGASASPGTPGYYLATDAASLETAIEQIFGGLDRPACTVRFAASVSEPSTLSVYLDDQQIPRSVNNGWTTLTQLNAAGKTEVTGIRIVGSYCDMVERFNVSLIEARFGCPPCVEGDTCR